MGTSETIEWSMYGMFLTMGVLSVLVNGFVLFLTRGCKGDWHGIADRLIVSIAIVDFVNGIVMVFAILWRVIAGSAVLESGPYCQAMGFFVTQVPFYSVMIVSILAFERYFKFSLRSLEGHSNKVYGFAGAVALILFGLALWNFFHAGYAPDPTSSYCQPRGSKLADAQNVFISALIFISAMTIIFSYMRIALLCLTAILHRDNRAHLTKRGVFHSLVFTFTYALCLGPVMVTIMWSSIDSSSTPLPLHMLSPCLIQMLMLVNPVLILVLSHKFRSLAHKFFFPRDARQKFRRSILP